MNQTDHKTRPKRKTKDFSPVSEKSGGGICDFGILRELRKRSGMSIALLAEKSGVSSSVISKLERNQTAAELETVYRLARAFGITLSDLISLAENRISHTAESEKYTSGGFSFERVSYANARCMRVTARKGAKLSTPEVHRDDSELCWVLSGKLRLELPNEHHLLGPGNAVQFDALLRHAYEVLEDVEMIIIHITKGKRF